MSYNLLSKTKQKKEKGRKRPRRVLRRNWSCLNESPKTNAISTKGLNIDEDNTSSPAHSRLSRNEIDEDDDLLDLITSSDDNTHSPTIDNYDTNDNLCAECAMEEPPIYDNKLDIENEITWLQCNVILIPIIIIILLIQI